MTASHGTYASYKSRGANCCEPCNKAGRAYARNRERQIAYGRWNPYTDAAPVRQHIERLQAEGLGWRRVADLSGVSRNTVNKIIYGRKDRPPTQRVRHETAAKILAVTADIDTLGDHARIDSTGTHRRLQALIALGWSQTKLADRLGLDIGNFNMMLLHRATVYVDTARAVRDLYEELWDTPPREVTRWEKQSASRARNYAAARGWALPMAWDDNIDDPTAEPEGMAAPGATPRRGLPKGDELLWLIELGETEQSIATAYGSKIPTVRAALKRARERAAQEQEAVSA